MHSDVSLCLKIYNVELKTSFPKGATTLKRKYIEVLHFQDVNYSYLQEPSVHYYKAVL